MGEIALLPDDVTTLYASPEALTAKLDEIEAWAREQPADTSTAKGRLEIRANAGKVTRSKTALDAAGKALTEEWRAKTSAVNAERKRGVMRLDVLAEDIRQPLTDWEAAEERRKEQLAARMRDLEPRAATTSDEIRAEIARIEMIDIGPDWDERREEAIHAQIRSVDALLTRFETKLELERLAAENARLQAEAAERDRIAALEQAERDRLAAEQKEKADAEAQRVADEAEKARAAQAAEEEARAKALREAQEAEAAEERAKVAREEAARQAAETARLAAEAEAKAASERAAQEAAEEIAAANRRAEAAEAAARAEREAAEQAEAARVAREKAAAEATAAREADEAHRAAVRAEIAAMALSLIESRTPEAAAEATADALIAGDIPRCAVQF